MLEARQRVAPLVPDIDPGDLLLILQSLLRPIGTGRRFGIIFSFGCLPTASPTP